MKNLPILLLMIAALSYSCTHSHPSNYTRSIILLNDGNYLSAESYQIKGNSMIAVLAATSDTIILSTEDVVDYGTPVW